MKDRLIFSAHAQTVRISYSMANRSLTVSETMPLLLACQKEGTSNFENPDENSIHQELSETCRMSCVDLSKAGSWLMSPWHNKKTLSIQHLFDTLVSHADYHQYSIVSDYFPSPMAIEFINLVIEMSQTQGRAITIPEQFNIAMNVASKNPTAAAIVAHAGSRAIARNLDTRIDPALNFTEDQMRTWNKSVARFTGDAYSEAMGDNYHFWAYCAMGMVTRANEETSPITSILWKAISYNGAEILTGATSIVTVGKKPLIFKHNRVAKIELKVGYYVAGNFLKGTK